MTYRLLLHSVRGQRYLAGNPSIHPIGDHLPDGGDEFTDYTDIMAYLQQEPDTLSHVWQADAIDHTGAHCLRFTRTNGVWILHNAVTPHPRQHTAFTFMSVEAIHATLHAMRTSPESHYPIHLNRTDFANFMWLLHHTYHGTQDPHLTEWAGDIASGIATTFHIDMI